ncbi:MAG: hypothetical protein II951_12810 [Bacteroidales bacterium]|nr:hypothetical protein [Bacteroidales bacterium]
MEEWSVIKVRKYFSSDEEDDWSMKILGFLLRVRVIVPLLLVVVVADTYFTHIGFVEYGVVFRNLNVLMRFLWFLLFTGLALALIPYMVVFGLLLHSKFPGIRIGWLGAVVPLAWMVGGVCLYVDVINPSFCRKLEEYYFTESHKQIGIVYSKYEPYKKKYKIARVGISESLTKEQEIYSKSFYKTVNVGDTVLVRVSDKYPRYNVVLSWHPNWMEIEKYKKPVKLVERKEEK